MLLWSLVWGLLGGAIVGSQLYRAHSGSGEPMAGDDRPLRQCLVPSPRSGISIMNQEHSVALCSLAQGDLLKNRCARALGIVGLALALGLGSGAGARAQSAPVGVPDKSFPESVTSTKDGTLYVGSFNLGGVVKAAPGGQAEPFIKPAAGDSRSTLGVLADENGGMPYGSSHALFGLGASGPRAAKRAAPKPFDRKCRAPEGCFSLQDTA